jgi:hypothetical protein
MKPFQLPRLVPQIRKPTIPDGYREMTVGGCNYLVHESEIPPKMSRPVVVEEILLEMWGGQTV